MNNDSRYADINAVNYPSCSNLEANRAMKSILTTIGRISNNYPAQKTNAIWKWTYGVRRVWISKKPTTGIRKGWGRLIHDASHLIFKARRPNARPHDHGHADVEREVLLFCQQRGYLDGALTPKKITYEEKRARKSASIDARIRSWETKLKRATNALKKLKKQRKAFDRATATIEAAQRSVA